jgi:hypothetical protein
MTATSLPGGLPWASGRLRPLATRRTGRAVLAALLAIVDTGLGLDCENLLGRRYVAPVHS